MRPKEHSAVLDASAVLVLLGDERGAAAVSRYVGSAVMGAVNHAEVVTKLVERGATPVEVQALLAGPAPTVVAFDRELAAQSGFLRAATRHLGLSLGDRACLALARHLLLPAVTADRTWQDLDVGVEVLLIR